MKSEHGPPMRSYAAVLYRRGRMAVSRLGLPRTVAAAEPRPGRQGAGRQQGLPPFSEDARRRRLRHRSGQEPALAKAGVAADARFDGLFGLRTNTKIAALQVVLRTGAIAFAFKHAGGTLVHQRPELAMVSEALGLSVPNVSMIPGPYAERAGFGPWVGGCVSAN